jgi:hypothetical protein
MEQGKRVFQGVDNHLEAFLMIGYFSANICSVNCSQNTASSHQILVNLSRQQHWPTGSSGSSSGSSTSPGGAASSDQILMWQNLLPSFLIQTAALVHVAQVPLLVPQQVSGAVSFSRF